MAEGTWVVSNGRRVRGSATLALAIVAVAAWIVLLWRGPALIDRSTWQELGPAEQAAAAAAFRSMLAQIGLGIGALGALVFTARNFYLAREGQVVDRYTRAVEQLGSEKVDVRLGGIFALERIMVDSPRDHDTVVQLLATFINEHAKLEEKDPSDYAPTARWLLPPTPTRLSRISHWRPPADIRAALAVLGRRPQRPEGDYLNLSGTDLRGARLEGARLRGIDLTGADLREADLSTADMEKAVLVMADLRTAILRSTNLQDAYMSESDLRGAILFGANLRNADLSRVHLEDARLEAANLHEADLTDAWLQGTDLQHVSGLTPTQIGQATLDDRTLLPAGLAATGEGADDQDGSSDRPRH